MPFAAGKGRQIVVNDKIVRVGDDRDELRAVLIEHIHGVIGNPQSIRVGLFILVHRQAINAARPAGKALGEPGIAHAHVQDRRTGHRHRVEDSLDAGLVTGGLLLCPVYCLADPCHPRLLEVTTELFVGSIGACLSRHGMISSAPAVVTPGHLKMYWRSCLFQKVGDRRTNMQLGVMLEGQEGLTWELWRRIMARVEELGFESLWRSDHFMSLVDSRRDALETWVALTLTAAETTRLRFGSLVCPMTFRHPSLLARMAAAVDTLSGGRLVLGVGAGWNAEEHHAFGIPFPPLTEPMSMLEEGIEVIVRLLGDGPAHFAGRYYQLDGAHPYPKPAQLPRIPLLIGTTSAGRMLRIVARYADEWDVPGITSPTEYCARRERLVAYCREINRDPRDIRRCVSTAYLIGRSAAELRRRGAAM